MLLETFCFLPIMSACGAIPLCGTSYYGTYG
jgi:hypothetical protein